MVVDNEKNSSNGRVDIPVCNIMGVNVAAINMDILKKYIDENVKNLSGKYICVTNVHTVVTSYRDDEYKNIQNNAILAIPDGAPLSKEGRRRGFKNMQRTTGPDFMGDIFSRSEEKGYRHFFYGSTQETLEKMELNIKSRYKNIQVVGKYSPPFRELTEDEEKNIQQMINDSNADFIWIGLGAPKQERFMAKHENQFNGLMIGVGAGFDYFAGNIKRAPKWMQKMSLEWLYRLIQKPKLFGRYFKTNFCFIWNAIIRKK